MLGAGAEGVVIRGAVVDEPLVPPPPPRCAIAMLAANAKKPVSTSVARRRCIIRKTLTEAGRSPKSRLAANLVFCWEFLQMCALGRAILRMAAAAPRLRVSILPRKANDRGLTALHVAAGNGQRLVVDELLMRGASLTIRDAVHRATPLDHARWAARRWPSAERADVARVLEAATSE